MRATEEVLALAERKLPYPVPLQGVAPVEIARGIVETAVVDVEGRAAGGGGIGGADHRERRVKGPRVQRLRPRPCDRKLKAIRQPALQLDFERVVSREVVRVEHVQSARILRVRNEEERLVG